MLFIVSWNGMDVLVCWDALGNNVISNDVCWVVTGDGKCQVSISVPTSHSLTHSLDATVVNSVLVTRLESRNAMQRRKVDGEMR